MPGCDGEAASAATTKTGGNPAVRRAAQKGLDYLESATADWQRRNDCYGCHVQAVTLEAFAVGRAHQYQVKFDSVFEGILKLKGGALHETGLGYTSPGAIYDTGKIFGAAALARYDQLVGSEHAQLLTAEAGKLIDMQQSTGQLTTNYSAEPVAISGDVQTTALSVVAWKQAYERSADDRWLSAIANAEDYLSGAVSGWKHAPPDEIQEINYAVMGLLAAGMGADEAAMVRLASELRERQNQDGGWGRTRGAGSEALYTGQTLYVLRLFGMTDSDALIDRGQRWIIEHQQADGSWSHGGFGKAEAMWSVLGLVSMDVLTVSVAGLDSGERLDASQVIAVNARDNEKGGGVVKVEMFVDDVRVAGACGASLEHKLDPAALGDGPHLVDVRATNAAGKSSVRRFEVFGRDIYLTRAGTRFAGGATEISARDIAPASDRHQVELEIFAADDNGEPVGQRIHGESVAGDQGSVRFTWSGAAAGARSASGKYVARLTARRDGSELQREDLVFVHASVEDQRAAWAQIEGDLSLDAEHAAAEANANAEVELVDADGNVVARTRSTRAGKYRFKNVKPGAGYSVRMNKKGWAAPAAQVRAEAGAPAAKVDMAAKKK
jgi:squalene-hopene/tetraprenyl-beta-curcumene cyclase